METTRTDHDDQVAATGDTDYSPQINEVGNVSVLSEALNLRRRLEQVSTLPVSPFVARTDDADDSMSGEPTATPPAEPPARQRHLEGPMTPYDAIAFRK